MCVSGYKRRTLTAYGNSRDAIRVYLGGHGPQSPAYRAPPSGGILGGLATLRRHWAGMRNDADRMRDAMAIEDTNLHARGAEIDAGKKRISHEDAYDP